MPTARPHPPYSEEFPRRVTAAHPEIPSCKGCKHVPTFSMLKCITVTYTGDRDRKHLYQEESCC